jgi:hypothetical protein
MKVAWLLNRKLEIQYWHDLETLFISFTALCIWFDAPFLAKPIPDEQSDLAWIFQAHKPDDGTAAYRKWQLFRPNFHDKILAHLSSYFNCDAIKNLLVAMRDMCIPPTWGDPEDLTPTGYITPGEGERVTHDRMIEAVETAILALLTDTSADGIERLATQEEPAPWAEAHAKINEDGIFQPPVIEQDLPAVVLDSMGKENPKASIGLFHRIRAISHEVTPGFTSGFHTSRWTSTAINQPSSGYQEWNKEFNTKLKKRPHVPDDAAVSYVGAFPPPGKKVKLNARETFLD